MKRILASLTTITTVSFLAAMPVKQAKADAWDYLIPAAVGAAVTYGVVTTIQNNNNQTPPTQGQEYNRGVIDGTNNANYDNPRFSRAYKEGYKQGKRNYVNSLNQ